MLFNGIRYLSTLTDKIFFWNSNYASENVSDDAINKVVQFLGDNQLEDVAVQENDCSPGWYASRVFSNPKTSILSKLVFGPPAVLANMLGLDKIFEADNYDVMSNSVYLSSNDVDIGLLSAARAKDYNLNSNPILYSMTPSLWNMVLPFAGAVQFFLFKAIVGSHFKNDI